MLGGPARSDSSGSHKSSGDQIVEKCPELACALFGFDLILIEQSVAQLFEAPGLLELAPDGGSHAIEAKAFARVWVERHKLIAEFRLHEVDGTTVQQLPHVPSTSSRVALRHRRQMRELVSPAGFEPATY